ncbi:hypothetical protein F2Q69_00053123 [Brassica cretica]|uniref:Uncharacterized protein n=1 Tax=Brassica cretica TaxID=69181 RepID=A0A8S9N2T8_BRACR|nr:hypothetical protein F2Q69_00053123 [Brassica cretica]
MQSLLRLKLLNHLRKSQNQRNRLQLNRPKLLPSLLRSLATRTSIIRPMLIRTINHAIITELWWRNQILV